MKQNGNFQRYTAATESNPGFFACASHDDTSVCGTVAAVPVFVIPAVLLRNAVVRLVNLRIIGNKAERASNGNTAFAQ